MLFSDEAKKDAELRCLASYQILKPVFEWLKNQKSLHPQWLDCQLVRNHDTNHHDVEIAIRRMYFTLDAQNNPKSQTNVACRLTYEAADTFIRVQCWANQWWVTSQDFGDTVEVPIADPEMFKHIRDHLDRLQLALVFDQYEINRKQEVATAKHEIPTKGDSTG